MKHTCRCTCTAYGGRCDCHFDGRTQGYAAALADVVWWLRRFARRDIVTENKLAANGAYKSASEAANWRMGVEAAADAIERGDVPRGGKT